MLVAVVFLYRGQAAAQLPVEVFAGNARSTVDIMFFKYIKGSKEQNTRFLFFNRNRASVDYKMTRTTNLPQFGFTEAFSYNYPGLRGFAPVAVVQVLSWGVYPKAGMQFASVKTNMTVFSWLVCETKRFPAIDHFLLVRYTPALTPRLNLFTQLEFVNAMPTERNQNFSLTQRMRVGLKLREFQFGAGIDALAVGKSSYSITTNMGAFLRYEF